jgi:hypothetical protein
MSVPEPRTAATARLFEYCAAICPVDIPTLTATELGWPCPVPAMTELGAFGWELIVVVPLPARSGEVVGVFRRDVVAPTLQSLIPSSVRLESPSFTLRAKGSGFNTTTEIIWNGIPEVTTYVSSTEVTTVVNMQTASVATTIPVGVRNGVVMSAETLPFTFEPAAVGEPSPPAPSTAPTLTALEPATVQLGQPSFTMRILGTGFTPTSVLVWNGADDVCAYVSDTELTTTVNMATAEVAITVTVEVRNAEMLSNSLPFTFLPA